MENTPRANALFRRAVHYSTPMLDRAFQKCVSVGSPTEADVDKLLIPIGDICDEGPSNRWIAVLGILILAIGERWNLWQDLEIPFSHVLGKVPVLAPPLDIANDIDDALSELLDRLVSPFPIYPIDATGTGVDCVTRGVNSRDEVVSSSLAAMEACGHRNALISFRNWIEVTDSASRSANLIASVLNYMHQGPHKSNFYDRAEFATLVCSPSRLHEHYRIAEPLFRRHCPSSTMELISHQFG